jgi:hypothetical protein
MSIVVLKLSVVKRKTEERPRKFAHCAGEIFQRWEQVQKSVKDTRCRSVRIYRYRCCRYKRTFRHYPEGASRKDQTERLQLFVVICWKLGLSLRSVSLMLSGLGLSLSHMTVWRNAQGRTQQLNRQNQWRSV